MSSDQILVDSSVWIAYFRGQSTPSAAALDALFDEDGLVMGDLILLEVLQGCTPDKLFESTRRLLAHVPVVALGGTHIAIEAARNYRSLRARGITVRKTIDMLIGTYCIVNNLALLHADRDFDAMEQHLGLRVYRG